MDPMGRSFARRAASSGGMPIGSQVDGNCDAWRTGCFLELPQMTDAAYPPPSGGPSLAPGGELRYNLRYAPPPISCMLDGLFTSANVDFSRSEPYLAALVGT